MSKTRILLGSALLLSLTAFMTVVTKPRPHVGKPGEAIVSSGSAVRLEARPSHTAVHQQGSEMFAELTVTLEGKTEPSHQQISLALVLDTSGSMAGSKMDDAKKAAHRLVDLLTETDELALISFGNDITTAPRRQLTFDNRRAFHAAIDAIEPVGATHLSGALEAGWKALQLSQGARRLVLVSDGKPTVGLLTDLELTNLLGQVHDDAITVTALGVGSDIDGALMLHLAERGGGMYGYLRDAGELEEILGREVSAARGAVVRNVELELQTKYFRVAEVAGRHPEWRNGHLLLHLADLRPNLPTRVLLRLESMQAPVGERATLSAAVSWRSLDGVRGSSDLSFSAEVVEDVETVTGSRDEAVYSRGIGAMGNLKLLAAAAAWERGDDTQARSMLDSARALFGMSADALAGDALVDEVQRGLSGSTGMLQKKEYARGLERKKLSAFGLENSGY